MTSCRWKHPTCWPAGYSRNRAAADKHRANIDWHQRIGRTTGNEIHAYDGSHRPNGCDGMPARVTDLRSRTDIAFRIFTDARAMGGIATWIFLPSLVLVLITGLMAMAVNPGYHSAGWAWAKLLSGILVFEWGFAAIQGQCNGSRTERSCLDPRGRSGRSRSIVGRRMEIALGAVCGRDSKCDLRLWRPRLTRLPD